MALAERAALGVLTTDAHGDPFEEQAAESERLGVPPVEPTVEREAARSPAELPPQLRVRCEALGNRDGGIVDLAEHVEGHAGRVRHDGGLTLVMLRGATATSTFTNVATHVVLDVVEHLGHRVLHRLHVL